MAGRTVPSPPTEAPGNFNTAALFNAQVRDLNNFALAVPVFSGYQASSQAISNSTWTSITIDTERLDSDGGHSTVTNTSRYTATVPGLYLVFGTVAWAASGTGYRRTAVALNGSRPQGSAAGFDQAQVVQAGTFAMALITMNGVGDYVELQGQQNSGGALSTAASSDFSASFGVVWVSR